MFFDKNGKKTGILHISRISTMCCESLLEDLKDFDLVSIKPLKFSNAPKNCMDPYIYENKTKYIELNRAYELDRGLNYIQGVTTSDELENFIHM